MDESTLNLSTILIVTASIFAAIAAVASAIATWKTASILHRDFLAKRTNWTTYLIDKNYFRHPHNDHHIYNLGFNVSNDSDANNSISSIDLIVEYERDDLSTGRLILPHDASLRDQNFHEDMSIISTPLYMRAHETISGWALFSLDSPSMKSIKPVRFSISFQDTRQDSFEISDIPIISEIIFENA